MYTYNKHAVISSSIFHFDWISLIVYTPQVMMNFKDMNYEQKRRDIPLTLTVSRIKNLTISFCTNE